MDVVSLVDEFEQWMSPESDATIATPEVKIIAGTRRLLELHQLFTCASTTIRITVDPSNSLNARSVQGQ